MYTYTLYARKYIHIYTYGRDTYRENLELNLKLKYKITIIMMRKDLKRKNDSLRSKKYPTNENFNNQSRKKE